MPIKTRELGKKALNEAEGFYLDFKKFIDRGNVVDLAIGIIIGAAFGSIVNSLVMDIISPVLGLMGDAALGELFLVLRYGNKNDSLAHIHYPTVLKAKEAGAITLNYGNFIQTVIRFFMVAFVLFFFIKFILLFKRKREAAATSTDWPCPKCKEMVKLGAVRCPHCTTEPISSEHQQNSLTIC